MTSNLSFQNKLTILRVLATKGAIKELAEAKSFAGLLDRIEKAHQKRNVIAHGWWSPGNVEGLARRMAIRVRGRRLSTESEQVPLMDLEATANEFLDIWEEMIGYAPVGISTPRRCSRPRGRSRGYPPHLGNIELYPKPSLLCMTDSLTHAHPHADPCAPRRHCSPSD